MHDEIGHYMQAVSDLKAQIESMRADAELGKLIRELATNVGDLTLRFDGVDGFSALIELPAEGGAVEVEADSMSLDDAVKEAIRKVKA